MQYHEAGKVHWNGAENTPRGLAGGVPAYVLKRAGG
jgi:hypothetical protein